MNKLILLIIALEFINISIHAQDPQWTNYTCGLYVGALATEGNHLWVGTGGGLVDIDKGNGTTNFYNQANSGLPKNDVSHLLIGQDGKKWMSCSNAGIVSWDGTNWIIYDSSNSGLPTNYIFSMAMSAAGVLWMGTDYGGLVRFDGTTWSAYTTANSGIPANWVTAVAIDNSGNIWAGTDYGLAKFNGTDWIVYNTSNSGLPADAISNITISDDGTLWICTNQGLTKFNGTSWTTYNSSNSGLPDNYVFPVEIDNNGAIWIGSMNGLSKFDGVNWTTYSSNNSGLPGNHVISLKIDSDNALWIGTFNNGLVKYDGSNWAPYNTSNSGLPDNWVNAAAIDLNGSKWFGTWSEGLSVLEGSNWTTLTTANSQLSGNGISSIAIDQNDDKWIGTGGGLTKISDTVFTVYTMANSDLPYDDVFSVAVDNSGLKWIGTYGGMASFNGTTWNVFHTYDSELPCNSVNTIAADADGLVWLGTSTASYGCGLTTFDGTNFYTYNTSNSGLPSMYVSCISIESNGTKWIGTYYGGLTKYNGTSWTTYNTSNSGIPSNAVYSIVFDQNGFIWVGTDAGLAKFDGTNWTVYNISNSGLPSNYIYSMIIDTDGSKWIGTGDGLAVYNEISIPNANFSYTGACNNMSTQFTDLTQVVGGGAVASWKWNFGDPASGISDSSTLQNPVHHYNLPGIYNVNLIVTSTDGFIDTLWHNVVINNPPSADFSNSSGCSNAPVQFTDQSMANGGLPVSSWYWDFGDPTSGTNGTSASQNPNHSFSVADTYSVTLIATTSGACHDTISKIVPVSQPPSLDAGPDQIIESGTATQLFATGSGGSGNYIWHWEPAGYLVDANVQDPITTNLLSSVIFTATISDVDTYCSESDQMTVTVTGGPLTAVISASPNPVCLGQSVQLNALVSGGTGNYTYLWNSDPPGFTSSLPNPIDTPQQSTSYYVNIYDPTDTITNSIEVLVGVCPGQPIVPQGPDMVDLATVTESLYTTNGSNDATSYEWQVSPPSVGTISGTGLTATVSWSRGDLTEAHISVRGLNEFGQGNWSEEKITLIQNSVGLKNESEYSLVLLPNPCNGKFKINTSMAISRIELLDRFGQTVFSTKGNSNNEYAVESLSNGVYIVRIYFSNLQVNTRKLIINH